MDRVKLYIQNTFKCVIIILKNQILKIFYYKEVRIYDKIIKNQKQNYKLVL